MKGNNPDGGRVNRIENGKMIQNELKHIHGKPLPYYSCDTLGAERELAHRLPGHHLAGLRHDYMVMKEIVHYVYSTIRFMMRITTGRFLIKLSAAA
jgi:hypothetical protein